MAKKSIVIDDMTRCMICGSPYIHIHHCFFGNPNRKLADEYGLIVPLCQKHHTGNNGVHFDRELDLYIKRLAQRKFEEQCGTREDFINTFGKSYL